jgi:hypothetical protein
VSYLAELAHRALDAITDDGRMPENVFLLIAAVTVLFALSQGWLSD